jgi:FMN phosphatase YigB (HAD superfamily)
VNLVLFDIDGTLLDNRGDDDLCYERAFRGAFGIARIDMDWANYPHCTDSCIAAEILRAHFGREPSDAELTRAREAYVAELRAAVASGRTVHAPTRGAAAAVRSLRRRKWPMALATGGWRASALIKLRHSGIPVTRLPGAFADDDVTREGIARIAQRRAEERAGAAAERVVFVGDAIWDIKACRALGLPFVGIGRADRGLRLRDAGAAEVLDDFTDRRRFHAALDRAVPPA